jgi:hypothetical protein
MAKGCALGIKPKLMLKNI